MASSSLNVFVKLYRKQLLLLCLFGLIAFASSAQQITISGYVYQQAPKGKDTIYPIPNVNVIDLRTFKGTSTDNNGFFTVQVQRGDTLIFASLAHKRDTFICPSEQERDKLFLRVMMQSRIRSLPEVEVYGKDFEGFKHDFVNLSIEDSVILRMAPQWKFEPVKETFGITIDGPLTALWNAFSKEGKELKKLARLIEEERKKAYMDSLYKRPIILKFLELNEREMEQLVAYCNFTTHYVEGATDYELLSALERCYTSFRRERY